MFTGIVEKVGKIVRVERKGGHGTLALETTPWDRPFVMGESIAVEGTCLTLARWSGNRLEFDLLNETFERTNLGEKKEGNRINLERSLRVGDTMGGHFVTGHVDGVGRVKSVMPIGRDHILEVCCAADLLAGMVPKGSIACSGISLTIVDLKPDAFTVHLIPHTWENTSVSEMKAGSGINIETDMLGKYVKRILEAGKPAQGLTWEKLREHGFAESG
ncbi:MAG: riboflavin synthase [bacterium]